MTWFREVFTIRKVLRASAIAALVPGLSLVIAPAAFLAQVFTEGPETPDKDDKIDLLGRGAGLAKTTGAIIALVQPTKDVLDVMIAEKVAELIFSVRHRAQVAEKNMDVKRDCANMGIVVSTVFFVAMLCARRNYDNDNPMSDATRTLDKVRA